MTPAELLASVDAWVCKCAHYRNRIENFDADRLVDLIAAGREGAWIAALRYDRNRGAGFLGYATPWIREWIKRAAIQMRAAVYTPTTVPVGEVAVAAWSAAQRWPVRLDAISNNGTLKERLPDPAPSAEDLLMREQDRRTVRRAVSTLTPRGRYIVRRAMRGRTQRSIGRELGISGERVRVLLNRELATLREALR